MTLETPAPPIRESLEHPSSRIELLRSGRLHAEGFPHAFFTRRGGHSPLPWGPLNFAASVGDDPGLVQLNLELAARSLEVAADRLYVLTQTHGTAQLWIDGSRARDEVARCEGDALLARPSAAAPLLACGVRTADCVPVLLADRRTGAVAAVHSGWRGTAANISQASVQQLLAAGSAAQDLIAAIGPHIEACCFEVGDDVARELVAASRAGESALVRVSGGRPRVNLRLVVRAQLLSAGLAPDSIDDVAGCTVCEPERFHSHRRDANRSGRLLSAIVPRGPRLV